MPTSQDHREWDDAFEDELRVVNARRQKPAASREGLVGLAISGGGIRSATFALGILESLRRIGILKQVDYLSTVSGGGYTGAWLSANCKRHPGWLEPEADWNESVKHLRRYSNYLSPQVGFFSADTWSMATIWLRNTFLVQLTVILAIACALMVPRLLYEVFVHWPDVRNLRWITILLFVLGAVGIAGNHWRLTARKPLKLLLAKGWLTGLEVALVLLAAAWAWAWMRSFAPFSGGEVSYLSATPVAALLVAAGFCLQPVAVRLVGALWPGSAPPQEVNYTQNWAQAVVIIPLMAAAFLVTAILWGSSLGLVGSPELARLDSYSGFFTTAWRYWPFPLSVVFVSFWLFSFGGIKCTTTTGKLMALVSPIVAVPVLHAFLSAVMLLMHAWAAEPSGAGAWKAFTWGPPLVTLSFVQTIVVLIAMMGRDSIDDVREWWSRLGAWLGIYAVAWMVITVSAVYAPRWVDFALNSHPLTMLTAGGGWLGTVLGGLFAGKSGNTGGEESAKSLTTQAKEVIAAVAPFAFIAGLLILVAFVLDRVVTINAGHTWTSVGGSNWRHEDHAAFLYVSLAVTGACLTALLVLAARVDINEFSLNAFYRNRLVRCYLGATRFGEGERNPQNFTGFDGQDDVPLAKLVERTPPLKECDPNEPPPPATTPRLYGPMHIVNCALNLGGSGDLALHTRQSAVFTLSPLYSGSRYRSREQTGKATELGYVRTEAYGGPLGAPTLGQAIAVSGAAASPNMGYHTSPVVAFLLTLFNVRLGWWFPNPRWPEIATPTPRFSLRYLFAELFGGASDKSRFVAISDGGHFENLAAYELVKRQCGVIIISDGECDPALTFEGLGSLIRMCEVDFGAKITLDVKEIRATGTPSWSAKRWAVGRIDYGAGIPEGKLIYLKASMTGAEDTAIRQYKSAHREFPHETTGDQFYGEDQFESYRRLGRELAADAFSRPLDAETTPAARAVAAVTS